MAMRDDGEPISRGQFDRRAADARALRDSVFAAAFFGAVFLINGILAILLIEFFQSIGWWEVPATESTHGAAILASRLQPRPIAAHRRPNPGEMVADAVIGRLESELRPPRQLRRRDNRA